MTVSSMLQNSSCSAVSASRSSAIARREGGLLEPFKMVHAAASCCRRVKQQNFWRLGTKSNASYPASCFSSCLALSGCSFFSHSKKWRDCIFCAGCDFDTQFSDTMYTSWAHQRLLPRYALALVGAVGSIPTGMLGSGMFGSHMNSNQPGDYPPLRVLAAMIRRHVLNPNEDQFDLFHFSWQPYLQDEYVYHMYGMFSHAQAAYEVNRVYRSAYERNFGFRNSTSVWNQWSYSLALSKAAMMTLQHVETQRGGVQYEHVIMIRADLAMIKDLNLAALSTDPRVVQTVCCLPSSNFPNAFDDTIHVLRGKHALQTFARLPFQNLVDPRAINGHSWLFRRLNESSLRVEWLDLAGGWDVFPYRRLREKSSCARQLGRETFSRYYCMDGKDADRLLFPHGRGNISFQQLYSIPLGRKDYVLMSDCFHNQTGICVGIPRAQEWQGKMRQANSCRPK